MIKLFIYKIANSINGKMYFGQTNNFNLRMWSHKNNSRLNKNHPLYNSINKYGLDNFSFEVVCICNSQEEADLKEMDLIKQFRTTERDFGYNITSGGFRFNHSEETKKKLSDNKIAFYQKRLEETGSKMTAYEILKIKSAIRPPITEETKNKISIANTGKNVGKVHSKEQSKKHSLYMKELYTNGHKVWNSGKTGFESKKKGTFTSLTEEQYNFICELYKQNFTYKEICEKFDSSKKSTIKRVIKKLKQ